jgi:hypothetical protein
MSRGINPLSLDDIDQTKVTWDKTTVDLSIYKNSILVPLFLLEEKKINLFLVIFWCNKHNDNV